MGEKRVIEQVASDEVYADDWFLKDSPTQDTSKISATNLKAILGADGTQALEEIANAIAEEYDSTHTYYNTGLVFHEGVLYQCTATSVTGTWDSTKWNVVDIKDLLDNVSINIGYLWNIISNTIAGNYDTSSTYNTGDYAIYSLKLYRCKDDGVTGAWNSSKWDEVNIPEYIDYVLANAGIVKDVKVDGTSVVNEQGEAEIEIPVKDVQVKTDSTYDSVVDDSGNAKIDLSSVTAYGEVPNLPQAIATFKDGADAPMKSLKVAIEPVQEGSGDPSPTNVRPILGWDEVDVTRSGKNLFDISQLVVGGITNDGDNISNTNFRRSPYIFVKKGTYEASRLIHSQWWKLYYYKNDENKTPIAFGFNNQTNASNTITFTEDVYVRLGFDYIPTEADEIMFTLGSESTYTTYDANSTTYTIDLGGTRYGGEVDVVSGVLTVDSVYYQFNSSKTYSITGSARLTNRWITSITNVDGVSDKIKSRSGVISSISPRDVEYISITVSGFCKNLSSPYPIINLNDSDSGLTASSSATDIANAVNTFLHQHTPQIVYELATPITYQLTPTAVKSLLGSNNVWADTGDINDCVYRRDMTYTIDDIIARLEALENA